MIWRREKRDMRARMKEKRNGTKKARGDMGKGSGREVRETREHERQLRKRR